MEGNAFARAKDQIPKRARDRNVGEADQKVRRDMQGDELRILQVAELMGQSDALKDGQAKQLKRDDTEDDRADDAGAPPK
jgi:hypothetical protein